MNIVKTGAAACAVGILLGAVAGQGAARADTLQDALVQAYQNNPRLRADRAQLRATDEGVAQALSNWRPTVEIRGDAGYEFRNQTRTGGDKSGDTTLPRGATLSIDQNLYRGGRTVAATRQAENLVRSNRAGLLVTEQDVLLDAVTAYVDVVQNQAVVELRINNERVLRRQLEATRDRFEVGEVTRTDVAQAESRLSRATADRILAVGDLANSRATYKNIIGAAPGRLEPTKPIKELPANEEEAVSLARELNYAVIERDFIERAARDAVDVVTGELLPTVTLQSDLTREFENSNQNSETDEISITARVTVPLYQSGSVSSRVRESKQVVAQRRDERNTAVRDAIEQATRGWEAVQTARAQIRSFTAEVRATTIALEGVQQEALVGSRTVLDVLDAEQELLDARVNLVRAERDEVVAAYQLRSAVGQLTAESLKLPVEKYDFTRNYRRVRNKWFGLGVEKE